MENKKIGDQILRCWYCKTGRKIYIGETTYGGGQEVMGFKMGKTRRIKDNFKCSTCGNFMPHPR